MSKKEKAKAKILAMDAELSPEQLDKILDAVIGVEDESVEKVENIPEATQPIAEDETPAEKVRGLLAGKVGDDVIGQICALIEAPAQDADKDAEETDKKLEGAMDAFRKELREADQARRDVEKTVGTVAMDSASAIYGFALDHMGVDHKGVNDATALKALFKVASEKSTPAPRIAQDSKSVDALVDRIPSLKRFQ